MDNFYPIFMKSSTIKIKHIKASMTPIISDRGQASINHQTDLFI